MVVWLKQISLRQTRCDSHLDVNDSTSVTCFQNEVQQKHDRIDILINCAGITN